MDPCRAFENLCVYFTVHVPPRAFISGKKHPMGVYLWKETPSAVHAPPRAFISGKKHPRVFLLWQEHPGRLIYTHSPVWALQAVRAESVRRGQAARNVCSSGRAAKTGTLHNGSDPSSVARDNVVLHSDGHVGGPQPGILAHRRSATDTVDRAPRRMGTAESTSTPPAGGPKAVLHIAEP